MVDDRHQIALVCIDRVTLYQCCALCRSRLSQGSWHYAIGAVFISAFNSDLFIGV